MFATRLLLLAWCVSASLPIQQAGSDPSKAKVFIQAIDGFGTDLTAALIGANVPLLIVTDQKDADLVIGGRRQHRSRGTYGDYVEDATLTITDRHTGTVVEAFTVSADSVEKLARACAARINERIVGPPPAPPTVPSPKPLVQDPPAPSSPSPALAADATRLFVQGDLNLLADFTEALRAELRANGTAVRIVQRGDEYDYNIIFVQNQAHAGAIVLDRQGLLVASSLDNAFRAKGAIDGAARKLAKQLASVKRD